MLPTLRKLASATAIVSAFAFSISTHAYAFRLKVPSIPNIPTIVHHTTKVVQQASKDVHNGFHELGKVKVEVGTSHSANNNGGEQMVDNRNTHEKTGIDISTAVAIPLIMPVIIKQPVETPKDGYFENAKPGCGNHCPVTVKDIADGKYEHPASDLPDANDIDSPNRWHPPVQQESSQPVE